MSEADIVIAAVGRPRFVRHEWLKAGCLVVDAGYDEGNVSDVAFEEALIRASAITPVRHGGLEGGKREWLVAPPVVVDRVRSALLSDPSPILAARLAAQEVPMNCSYPNALIFKTGASRAGSITYSDLVTKEQS